MRGDNKAATFVAHPLIDGIAASPDVFIHQFDIAGDRALIIRLSADQLRKASFLDERVLGQGVEGGWAAWREIEASARSAPAANVNFIFHVGHCGSTLISRLIEEISGTRSLREPLAVRQLALASVDILDRLSIWNESDLTNRLDLFLRTISKGLKTIVKAASWCSDLVNRTGGAAVFCYSKPDAYIATMLGGANNQIDLKLNAAMRMRRLRRIAGALVADIASLSPGELAAMSWATETTTIAAAAKHDPARIHAIEFDEFLSRPEEELAVALAHLSLPASQDKIRSALSGPLMRTYSKDASFSYTPADRREFLGEYRKAHGAEIARGRSWLEKAGGTYPAIAAALADFG